jgi:hypothetical protein
MDMPCQLWSGHLGILRWFPSLLCPCRAQHLPYWVRQGADSHRPAVAAFWLAFTPVLSASVQSWGLSHENAKSSWPAGVVLGTQSSVHCLFLSVSHSFFKKENQ